MNADRFIKALFVIAALYDGALGAIFLIAPQWVYRVADITPPNHWAYIQFPAALLLIFGLMFAAIAAHPLENRKLIPYGVLLKLAYCGIALAYWVTADIPNLWKPFAIIDILMGFLFLWSYQHLGSRQAGVPAPGV
jgi:hypothetical protein